MIPKKIIFLLRLFQLDTWSLIILLLILLTYILSLLLDVNSLVFTALNFIFLFLQSRIVRLRLVHINWLLMSSLYLVVRSVLVILVILIVIYTIEIILIVILINLVVILIIIVITMLSTNEWLGWVFVSISVKAVIVIIKIINIVIICVFICVFLRQGNSLPLLLLILIFPVASIILVIVVVRERIMFLKLIVLTPDSRIVSRAIVPT